MTVSAKVKGGKMLTYKQKKPWLKRVIISLVGLSVAAGVLVLSRAKPPEVEVATARVGELRVTINEDGVTRVRDRYVVSAPLAGSLARMELRAGDFVKQGDIVARLLPQRAPLLDSRTRTETEAHVAAAFAGLEQAKSQIERARAAREYAAAEAANTRRLQRQGTLSKQELDRAVLDERTRMAELTSAEFGAKVAAHEFAMARTALGRLDGKGGDPTDRFEVTSPVAGRILKVLQESEGVVAAGARLLEVGDPAALEIAVDVLTSDAVHIKAGAPVSIEDWGGSALEGSVRSIEPSAFTRLSALGVEEQRINAVVDITTPYEQWQALGDGYRVEAKVEVYRNPKALSIPWSALFRQGDAWAVFTLEGGKAHLVRVQVGRRNAMDAEILGGLSPGARVLLHPSDRIADGLSVTQSS